MTEHAWNQLPNSQIVSQLSNNAASFIDDGVELFHVLSWNEDVRIEGDLNNEWFWARFVETDAEKREGFGTIVIDGDLTVEGDILANGEFHLLVTGSVSGAVMKTGGHAYCSVGKNATIDKAICLYGNDSMTVIDGETTTPFIVTFGQSAWIDAPDACWIHGYRDDRETNKRIYEATVLDDDGCLNLDAFLAHLDAGKTPFRVDYDAFITAFVDLGSGELSRCQRGVDALVGLGLADVTFHSGNLQGLTALHMLSNQPESTTEEMNEMVKKLVDAGANVEASYDDYPRRRSTLQTAILGRASKLAEALIANGADLYGVSAMKTIDRFLVSQIEEQYGNEWHDEAATFFKEVATILTDLGFNNAEEIHRVIDGHIDALKGGATEAPVELRYRPFGWNEHAFWDESRGWLVQQGQIPESARYDVEEGEWISEVPDETGGLVRSYYRTDGTLCCVAEIADPDQPEAFKMTRYHENGEVSMTAFRRDGEWDGEKVDYVCREETSEHFVIYSVPDNVAKAVSKYEDGRLVRIELYDYSDVLVDSDGNVINA